MRNHWRISRLRLQTFPREMTLPRGLLGAQKRPRKWTSIPVLTSQWKTPRLQQMWILGVQFRIPPTWGPHGRTTLLRLTTRKHQ
jgi:hypothetical protein